MTREEAIKILQKQKNEYLEKWIDYSGIAKAFDIAIESLQADKRSGITNNCSHCKYTDDVVYTSLPPTYKCSITGEFHFALDDCNVEFEPVKHGRWIEDEYGIPHCSKCGTINNTVYRNFCSNCGTKMDLDEVEK